jgi:hypothetical protein
MEDDMYFQKRIAMIAIVAGTAVATGGIDGPFFEPPGSPGFTVTDDGGWPSLPGGVTWSFSGFDLVECVRGLHYGKDAGFEFAASLDGGLDPGESMIFNGIIGAAGNTAEWIGYTFIYVYNAPQNDYLPVGVTTRMRMTLARTDGTPIPLALPASVDGTFPAAADACAKITGDFRDHWTLEASDGSGWEPFRDFYDVRLTPPPSHPHAGTAFDLGTAFYTSDACPVDLALPIGVLDLSDIVAFVTAFTSSDPAADLAEPLGVQDLQDIVAFVATFTDGCP